MPETLSKKQARFAQAVALLLQEAKNQGNDVTLGEAYRPPEMAQLNAASGKGISNSLHTIRLAIDLNLLRGGKYLSRSEDYLPLGEWWEKQGEGYSWGGRFQSRPDGNHFSFEHNGVR
jgi:D-alanyl-D-alanine carboxypeptidase